MFIFMKVQQKELIINLIIALVIFTVALIPRILNADLFINPDAADFWFERTENFYRALDDLNFSETFQTGHPGVTLMWFSGASMLLKNYFSGASDIFDFSNKSNLLFAAKLPIILVTSLTVSLIYLLIKELFNNRRIALLCVFFVLIDPFYLAQSRFFQMDALLSSFIILSILTIHLFFNATKRKYIYLSALFTALALLTKQPALILIPYFFILFLIAQHQNFSQWIFKYLSYFDLKSWGILKEKYVKYFLVWLIVAIVFFVMFWPAIWVGNFDILERFPIRGILAKHKLNLNESSLFVEMLFYPLILLTRITLPVLISFVIGIIFLLKNIFNKYTKDFIFKLLLFIFLWLFLFSISMKKAETGRYILPVFVSIDIIAGITLFVFLNKIKSCFWDRARRYFVYILVGIIFVVQTGIVFSYYPYYSAYRNFLFEPLANSPLKISTALVLGWGEGLDEAARWLNQKENSQDLIVASWFCNVVKTFFDGYVISLDWWERSDYVVLYYSQIYSGWYPELLDKTIYNENITPVYVVKIKNRPYAWIYKTDDICSVKLN